MPYHMLALWKSGRCPVLVPAVFWEEGDGLRVRLDAEGLVHAVSYCAFLPDGLEESFVTLLEMLAGAAKSFAALQQWMADPAYIALDPDALFYDREKRRTLLAFSCFPDGRPFFERFLDLCRGVGRSGELIADRLQAAACRVRMEERCTAAFLEGWIRTIRE